MPRWIFGASLAVAAAVLATACSSSNSGQQPAASAATKAAATPAPASATDLVALKKAPASLAGDDPAWKDAPTTSIKTVVLEKSDAKTPVTVKAQALYNDSDIWFRLEWPDATKSDTSVWTWDGTKWASTSPIADRLALTWDMTKIPDFDAKGCQQACHSSSTTEPKEWYMIAPKAGDTLDFWQWQAASAGAMGQMTDQTFVGGALPDPKNLGSSFVSDALESGGTVSNSAAAPATPGPLKMQDPSKGTTFGKSYLAAAEAMPLDMSKLKAGDTVPRTMLAKMVGSRGDIDAKQAWADNKWTVVLHRKLDTGHTDDVKFVPAQQYPFALAVFNDLDHWNHTVSDTAYLLKFK